MTKVNHYKETKSLEDRKKESIRICKKYKIKVPVIVILDKNLNKEKKYYKFVITSDISISSLYSIIRQRIHIDSKQSLFCLTEANTLLTGTMPMYEVYSRYKDKEDGMLYIYLNVENTFGCSN